MLFRSGFAGGGARAAEDEASGEAVKPGEAEKNWSIEAGYDYSSIYLFRGLNILDGNNISVPRVVVTVGGFSFYNYDYLGSLGANSLRYEEFDFGADYTFGLADDKLSFTFGGVKYAYGNDDSGVNTYELYGSASLDVLLTPTITVWRDVKALDSTFVAFDLSHSFDLTKPLHMGDDMAFSIDLIGEIGYDHDYVGPLFDEKRSGGAWNNAFFGIDFPFQACEHFAIHASAQRSIALHALDINNRKDFTSYNFGATFSF